MTLVFSLPNRGDVYAAIKDEKGAVTVDWVVLVASLIVLVGLVAMPTLMGNVDALQTTTGNQIATTNSALSTLNGARIVD